MSLARVIRRSHPKYFATPTPKSRPIARPANPGPSFAHGLYRPASVLREWTEGGVSFRLISDPDALERDGGFPLTLVAYPEGKPAETHGFDSLADVECMAWHISAPPETFPEDYPDECPDSPEAACHDEADELWWAQGGDNSESELDAWLDSLAPADYADTEGGAL